MLDLIISAGIADGRKCQAVPAYFKVVLGLLVVNAGGNNYRIYNGLAITARYCETITYQELAQFITTWNK